ncbi:WD40 repeat domain-containing protein [Allorhodopirellula solitaria]|uniref:WD domain, G-beta repeat n=1 Tax=Allorhodopirellula solitaria TaxID=2527987 RepID=A0A5C5YK53_9BACT|nr:WD40 repeat domain-containing protein [Allorhodopirellula solitaria]TWT75280.1 WD domain, G-beta repeat [Allorhodopirellula solitaria]
MKNWKFLKYLPPLPSRRQVVAVTIGAVFLGLTGWMLNRWFTTEYDLAGHRAAPHGIVFVDQHDLVATACADLHLYLFSATDGSPIRRIGGHTKRLTSISTYQDADVVATGSADGQVKIWSLPRGIEERSIMAHQGGVLSVRYSHDGSVLASVGKDKTIRVWDAANGEMVTEISTGKPNECLAMNMSGSLVAAGGFGEDLVIWTVKTGRELKRLSGDAAATSACFCSDGTLLAVGRDSGVVELWNTGTWQRQQKWQDHGAGINDVTFSADSRKMFTASGDRKIGVYDLDNQLFLGVIKGHPKKVLSVATSPSGSIASAGYGPWARLWTDPLAELQ